MKTKEIGNSFTALFNSQVEFQKLVLRKRKGPTETAILLPGDHLDDFNYHINGMVEELGELMKADKRWKTHRNASYDEDNKLEELCDVMIEAFNLVIFSGFSEEQLYIAMTDKIGKNTVRLLSEK